MRKTIKKVTFGAEGFFNTYLSNFQILLGADLEMYSKQNDQLFNNENPCNLYFILKRPKVSIDPDSFRSEGKTAFFDLIVYEKEEVKVISIGVELKKAESNLKLVTEFPFNMFTIEDNGGVLLAARPGTLIDSDDDSKIFDFDFLDYEVLYIGQAFGKSGERTALNRLMKHETLQKIYTHSLTNNPDSDIWILLTHFAITSSLFVSGTANVIPSTTGEKRDEELIDHFLTNNGLKITKKQIINLTEAALIKYFQPQYNKDFTNEFPSQLHKSYSEYYDLDVRAISIELDTSELNRKLYTNSVERKEYHSAMYELKSDNDRISMIDAFNK